MTGIMGKRRYLAAVVENLLWLGQTVGGVVLLPRAVLTEKHGRPVADEGHHGILLLSALQSEDNVIISVGYSALIEVYSFTDKLPWALIEGENNETGWGETGYD